MTQKETTRLALSEQQLLELGGGRVAKGCAPQGGHLDVHRPKTSQQVQGDVIHLCPPDQFTGARCELARDLSHQGLMAAVAGELNAHVFVLIDNWQAALAKMPSHGGDCVPTNDHDR